MKQQLTLTTLAASVALMLTAGSAQAALLDEHNGQLYDNVTNLVWLQDANLAKSNTFGVSGIDSNGYMNWSTANSWIAAMNAANYLGHNDWMLPTVSPVNGASFNYNFSYDGTTDHTFNNTSQASQLGYMYYQNLGLKGQYSPSGAYQPDFGVMGNGAYGRGVQTSVGLVNNLQGWYYWNSLAYAPNATGAWEYAITGGAQGWDYQSNANVAWAVRTATAADIAAVTAVPEPETYAMLVAGLGLLGAVARRKSRQQA
jgi:hypothetical protein